MVPSGIVQGAIRVQNHAGNTFLHCTAAQSTDLEMYLELVWCLLESYNAPSVFRNLAGNTILHCAAAQSNNSYFKLSYTLAKDASTKEL